MRKALLAAAVVRAALSLIAIPLAPFLYRKHAAVLILLRPTKETLLYEGYAVHHGDVSLPVAILAALPMLLLGVWQFYALGRMYKAEIRKQELPGIAGRVLPPGRVQKLQRALKSQGDKVVFLARLAAMPSSLIAAAAGSSGYDWRRFLRTLWVASLGPAFRLCQRNVAPALLFATRTAMLRRLWNDAPRTEPARALHCSVPQDHAGTERRPSWTARLPS